jgi:formylglycine-generating enzyme required for sulfatase activity
MYRTKSTSAYQLSFFLLVATAAPSNGCDDSGDGVNSNDAGVNTNDASTNPVDNDDDGYPASEDCDDNDDSIYPGVSRDCQSDCDYGVQICLADSTWLDCTARTDCDCTTPGDTRIVDCGNCGEASQECGLDLQWEYPGDCLNEGECSAGAMETDVCDLCGSRSRICSNQCTWGTWDESACTGICSPGERLYEPSVTSPWLTVISECSSSCEFEVIEEGSADCLLPPRAGNLDYKDEICVEAGPFIMGAPCAVPSGGYEHTINLSAYFIDKYAVTVSRYRECVQSGGCQAPTDPDSTYFDSNAEAKPITEVDWNQADVFCQWDGGRRLPTEAQWEKAAKGPAPRQVTYPWGDDEPICGLAPLYDCGQPMTTPWNVDDCPNGASYNGVEMIGTNVREWISDWYDAGYYSTSPTVDPQGPSTGPWDKVLRGRIWSATNTITCPLSWRYFATIDTTRHDRGFRCARSAK